MRTPWDGRTGTQPVTEPSVIETWMPGLWARAGILFTPVLGSPLLIWLAATEPEEIFLTPWALAWVGVAAYLVYMTLTALRARVVLRDDGVVIRKAMRDRPMTWAELHSAVAHWDGLYLRSYEPWRSEFDRYATSGILIQDRRRPWRLRKRALAAADRINEELIHRTGRPPLGPPA